MARRGTLTSVATGLLVALVLPLAAVGQSPSPFPGPGSPSPSIGPPEPKLTTVPLRLRRSAMVERDGVRLRVELERNPMPAGELT